jgi:uracil-DNA glycosylase
MHYNCHHNGIRYSNELQKPYFEELHATSKGVWEHNLLSASRINFSAFDYCDFGNLKVVIIGQDPYHGEGEANGLVFRLTMR